MVSLVTVGHNEPALARIPRTDGTSRNTNRPCFVANGFQVSQHRVEVNGKPSNIFTNEPTGEQVFNNTVSFRPEPTVILRAESLPGDGSWLTRPSSRDDVNADEAVVTSKDITTGSLTMDFSDIMATNYARPMLLQHLQAIGVAFHLPQRLDAHSLEAEVEAANP